MSAPTWAGPSLTCRNPRRRYRCRGSGHPGPAWAVEGFRRASVECLRPVRGGCVAGCARRPGGLINREVLDGPAFVANVEHLRQEPRLASAIGNQVSDAAVARRADLVAVKPLVARVSATVIASDAAGPIFRSAANQAHAAFTTADSDQVVLRLADFGAVVSAVLREVSPQAAAAIPADLPVRLAVVGGQGGAIGRVVQGAHLAATLAWLLPLLALAQPCRPAASLLLHGRGGAVVVLLARPVQSSDPGSLGP